MVNLSCSEQFLRLFVFIFNVAFFIFGVLLIAVGAYAIATVQDFSEFDVDSVKSVSGVFIACGVIIFLIGLLGCCGAFQKSHWLMYAYSVAILIMLILQLALGVYTLVERDHVADVLTDSMQSTMKKYDTDSTTAKAWDKVQEDLDCCGYDGPASWNVTFEDGSTVPDSCCKTVTNGCGNAVGYHSNDIFTKDCKTQVEDALADSMLVRGLCAIIFALLQLLGVLAGCCLGNAFREYERVE